jgi:hypothetical protein
MDLGRNKVPPGVEVILVHRPSQPLLHIHHRHPSPAIHLIRRLKSIDQRVSLQIILNPRSQRPASARAEALI